MIQILRFLAMRTQMIQILRFLAAQVAVFMAVVATGWHLVGQPPPGTVDWSVTGAYGAMVAMLALPIWRRRDRALACCVGAFFLLGWGTSAVTIYYHIGFIGHTPIVFGAICAMCVYHEQHVLTLLSAALAVVSLAELLIFGLALSPGDNAGAFVVVHQCLFVAWIIAAVVALNPPAPQKTGTHEDETQAPAVRCTTEAETPAKVA